MQRLLSALCNCNPSRGTEKGLVLTPVLPRMGQDVAEVPQDLGFAYTASQSRSSQHRVNKASYGDIVILPVR